MVTGGCLCGRVRYTYAGDIDNIVFCHCLECRKAQGTPFASNAPAEKALFTLERGADELASYESSPGKMRVFCQRCGSPIYSHINTLPNVLRLRLGSLDTPLAKTAPDYHIFVVDKATWYPILDGSPQFDGFKPVSMQLTMESTQ